MPRREVADQLKRAADVTFKGWRVSTRCSEHDWSLNARQPAGASARAEEASSSSLPLGAFEVNLVWEVDGRKRVACMHSKLRSRKFPDTFKMLSSLVKLVGAHAQALLSSGAGEGEGPEMTAPSPHREGPADEKGAAEVEEAVSGGGGGGASGGSEEVQGSGDLGQAGEEEASPDVVGEEVVMQGRGGEGNFEVESPPRVVAE